MLKSKENPLSISTRQFAAFNEQLYYNPDLPKDEFTLPDDVATAKITAQD
jgi:hypothetical protein